MEYRFDDALPVLRRTPTVLRTLLLDLPGTWIAAAEGPGTWTPFDIVGHLIHGERTDWVPRVEHMLQHADAVPFPAFDREAMFAASQGLSLGDLLDTFGRLRTENLDHLVALGLTDVDLARHGRHPEFGVVTLGQHLATWVAHDLSHVGQVVRKLPDGLRKRRPSAGKWSAHEHACHLAAVQPMFFDRVKVAKVQGTLAWHRHDNEDELFLILKGRLRIEMENDGVDLGEGEMFVVPKGVRHNPVAEQECHVLLIERKSTLHTGDVVTEKTRSIADQLRPV